ncbi:MULTISPECIES: hypothetical protein [Maricaulis]|jgi:hypothetical protein|nr:MULTISPECIES: hypothetical protein [Maricaulis]MAC90028.1 hypothetical protein [Maricaulis sp.]RKQ89529.1 hypothetical protein C7435_3390 [Maricaulis maris]
MTNFAQPALRAFAVRDGDEATGRKSFWREIGAAWTTKGGHIRLKLDALPPDGVVMLLDDARSAKKPSRKSSKKAAL